MSKWQTLDTCPSDGERILAFGGGLYETISLCLADGEWWRSCRKNGNKFIPTHWMPLPAPPNPKP